MKRIATAALVLFASCGAQPEAKPAAKPAVATRPAAAAPPTATEELPQEVYTYSPLGKRDPFRSPVDDLVIAGSKASQCPLCRWELDQLHLVAIITGTGSPVGMVEDPDGVGHVVRQGTQLGKNGGKVTTIRGDELLVVENSHDPFGKAVVNKTVLKIPRNAAEVPQATSLLDE